MKVEGVDDEKSGAVTLDSVLLIDFDTREDTWGKVKIYFIFYLIFFDVK